MDILNLTLGSEAFLAAGRLINGPKSPLSPFVSSGEAGDAEPPASLMSGGKLKDAYKLPMQTLAWANGFGTAAYVSADELLDVSVYHSDAGRPDVALFLAGDGVKITSPADTTALIDWLGQRVGTSLLRRSALDLTLSYAETRAMLAVVDAARRNELIAMAGGEVGATSRKAVIDAMLNIESDLQWLAPHFSQSHGMKTVSETEAEQQLLKLAQKRFVVLEGNEISLSDNLASLAEDMLIISSHMLLKKAEVDQNQKIRMTEIRVVQGCNQSCLVWTDDGKQVQLMSASPAQVMRIVFDCLGGSDATVFESTTASAVSKAATMDRRGQKKAKKAGKKKRRWWLVPLILFILFAIFTALNWFFVWI